MRWFKVLPFLLIPVFGFCEHETQQVKPIYDFSRGLDTYHSSLSLPDGYVQASLNGFFDAVAPFSKRAGYQVSFSTKSYAFQQAWTYTDPTNTSWIIVRASDTLIANNLSGSSSVKIATVSVNNLVGEANAFGNAYFVDQTQGVYYWNGSSVTYVSGSPYGSLITQFHNRLWVSGAAVPNGNQIYGSALYSGTTWATNVNPNDPVQLTAGLQDNFDNVTAMYVFLDTMYVGKHYAIYGLSGYDQTSFQIAQLTQECGILDQNSIQTFGGDLKFVSLRGVEDFNGYTCNRISDPVKNLVDPSIQASGFTTQSWVQSQVPDWNSGTISPSGSLVTTVYPPALSVSTGSLITGTTSYFSGSLLNSVNISNYSFENSLNNWTTISGPGYFGDQTSAHTDHNGVIYAEDGTYFLDHYALYMTTFSVSFIDAVSSATIATTGNIGGYISGTWSLITIAMGSYSGRYGRIQIFDGYGVLESDPFVSNGNNISFYYIQDTEYGYSHLFFDNFNGLPEATQWVASSGTFTSQVHAISSINSWGNFAVSDLLSGSGDSIVFSICSSANSGMSPKTCASQTPNSQISISTNSYVQWNATFTVTLATQSPTLNSVSVQWFSGSRATPMSSTVWDNRYWLSLTTSTADTANDAILVLGHSMSWGLLDIHAGGLTQYKGSLYHSDSRASGNVYQDNQGTTDNGANINTYLITKDFKSTDLNADNYFNSLYMSMDDIGGTACTGTVYYFLDHNKSIPFTLTTIQQSEFANTIAVKIPFALGTNQDFGHTIALEYDENDNCGLNLYGFSPYYFERPVQ